MAKANRFALTQAEMADVAYRKRIEARPAPITIQNEEGAREVVTDMVMITLFMNEGGERGYLKVSEGNKTVHLLHVPTLEYLKLSIEDVGRFQKGDPRPVHPDLAGRLHDKAVFYEMNHMRYSRVLVSEALVKLGEQPLIFKDEVAVAEGGEVKQPKPVAAGSKAQMIADLLLRKEGCTTKDVLAATGWPAVSMPQQAKVAGLVLRKEKIDGTTRYWGAKNRLGLTGRERNMPILQAQDILAKNGKKESRLA